MLLGSSKIIVCLSTFACLKEKLYAAIILFFWLKRKGIYTEKKDYLNKRNVVLNSFYQIFFRSKELFLETKMIFFI